MKENSPALREEWVLGEDIDDKGIYKKLKYRKVEQIGFYIRPLRDWFFPCPDCQKRLKQQMATGAWILGNQEYKPDIELNNTKDEIDDNSWITLEEHKATPAEIKRIGKDGWRDIEE
jgi:hypothetical protein